MYTDTILLIAGCGCAVISILLASYLILSRKRGALYRLTLRQETEGFDAGTTMAPSPAGTDWGYTDAGRTEPLTTENGMLENGTRRLIADGTTEPLHDGASAAGRLVDFDASALCGRYTLEEEITGGGMSRIFIARSAKLGNRWIVKFISNQMGELAEEKNILKLLNHISLPKIVDIFHDDKGTYIVESLIEGMPLNRLLETGQKLGQGIIFDWIEQLAQVLAYLHEMEPYPVFHFDLKPSNIIVTHNNRLVLIDFGVSRLYGKGSGDIAGVTYGYAAPELLKHRIAEKYLPIVEARFGELPTDRLYWEPDARTDIYSLGIILFELATGQSPTVKNIDLLRRAVSPDLYAMIVKCMEARPDERYQSARELLADLQKSRGSRLKMARTLAIRKVVSVSTAFSMLLSVGSLSGGYYMLSQENMAIMDVEPEIVVLSLQQSSDLKVEKRMPDGRTDTLDSGRIEWCFEYDDIAKVDGGRIIGMNVGSTGITGSYRNKSITLKVNVIRPMEGMVDIAQRYQSDHFVWLYAGGGERDHSDGPLAGAEFVSPESIDMSEDGTVYVTDSGLLRKIGNGGVESINFEPGYLTARMVRCRRNDVYILTNEWYEDGNAYYGIIRLNGEEAEGLYISDANFTEIEDFTFSSGGLMYFIDRNDGAREVYLKTLNPENPEEIKTLRKLSYGCSGLDIDGQGRVYISNKETGVIYMYHDGELKFFAGAENERGFIDGTAPLFYAPQRLRYSNDFLFVWDFNTLRRVTVGGGVAGECITIAGVASPEFDLSVSGERRKAEEVIMPNSKLADFIIKDKRALITDPKRGVIWMAE